MNPGQFKLLQAVEQAFVGRPEFSLEVLCGCQVLGIKGALDCPNLRTQVIADLSNSASG